MTRNQPCPQHRVRCDQAGGCVAQQVSRCRLGRVSPRCQPLQRQQRAGAARPARHDPTAAPGLRLLSARRSRSMHAEESQVPPAPLPRLMPRTEHRRLQPVQVLRALVSAEPQMEGRAAPPHRSKRRQQAVLMLHKTRELLVRQRTMQTNALRAHLAELGIVAAQGVEGLGSLKTYFQRVRGSLPEHAAAALQTLIRVTDCLVDEIKRLESRILDWHRANDASR